MRCIIVAILASVLAIQAEEPPGQELESPVLSLESAITLGLQHNRKLGQLGLAVSSADVRRKAADADFLPRLEPSSSVGVSDRGDSMSYGLGAAQKLPIGTEVSISASLEELPEDQLEDHRIGRARISLSQPLLRRFGTLVHRENILLADSRFREAQRSLEQARADLVVEIVRAYERVLQLEQQLAADERFLTRLDKLLRLTRARESQGNTTRVDTLRVELQYGEALAKKEASVDLLSEQRRSLADLLGRDPLETFTLETTPMVEINLPSEQEALVTALSNRLDFAQVLDQAGDQLRALRIARRTAWPDISLSARYEESGQGDSLSEAFDFTDDDWFIGLSLGSELNPAREKAVRREALFDHQRSLQELEIRRVEIVRAIHQQVSGIRRLQSEFRAAQDNIALAEKRARLAQRLFEMGRGDNFSVTDAEEALARSENAFYRAKAELNTGAYSLLRELGTLLDFPDNLKPGSFLQSL